MVKRIALELFYFSAAAIACFSLLEAVWPGVVLSVFNLNWLLIFWFFIGIVLISWREDNKPS